jgi:ATP-dependent exoDNAse (exonuclease V) alpha subunit
MSDFWAKQHGLLCGQAGTGKSFLAAKKCEEAYFSTRLLATTGIAAVNLGGTATTINSFLGYYDTKALKDMWVTGKLKSRIKKVANLGVERLVIDECSMLPADQLTYLMKAIEESGTGLGITLVGDFGQLPPVDAEFCYRSPEWPPFTENILELTQPYRFTDPTYYTLLEKIRSGRAIEAADLLDRSVFVSALDTEFDGTTILAVNEAIDRFNDARLHKLPGKDLRFPTLRRDEQKSEWKKLIPDILRLKEGALVVITANSVQAKRIIYANGDLGTLMNSGTEAHALVKLKRTGEVVPVYYVTREYKRLNNDGDEIIVGEITYMPLRPAYASTVHKAQGLTFDSTQIDLRNFLFDSPGMLYVAMSRVRSQAGLKIVGTPELFVKRCVPNGGLIGFEKSLEGAKKAATLGARRLLDL